MIDELNPPHNPLFDVTTTNSALETSLCFEFQGDQPGILSESLTEFASRDINLVKIESRPNKKSLGRYVFLVDIEGHRTDEKVAKSIESLSSKVAMIKVLGSYPKFI